ncbi:MAG: hypothetical protein K8F25_02440, partial [Fimbriimonadaceae bacterium]|nr:hypothetical protein [Alphaproteobacteria bacterium]
VIISPYVIALPHTGFYATSGTTVLEKIGNFLFRSDNPLYSWILISGVLGVALIRLLQLVGAISLLRNGNWASLLLLLGWCSFILLINGPIASPKYRLPMEPALMVLVGCGLTARSREKGK